MRENVHNIFDVRLLTEVLLLKIFDAALSVEIFYERYSTSGGRLFTM